MQAAALLSGARGVTCKFIRRLRAGMDGCGMKFLFKRSLITGFLIGLQFVLIVLGIFTLSNKIVYVYAGLQVISLITLILVINKKDNPSYKLSWIVVILLLPPVGVIIYMMWGNTVFTRSVKNRINKSFETFRFQLPQNEQSEAKLRAFSRTYARQSEYLKRSTGHSVYNDTETDYYSPAEAAFPHILAELKKATRFIFIEFFILAEGKMWDEIHAVLREKAAEGVEIKIISDDIGSGDRQQEGFVRRLAAENIEMVSYNRFRPALNTFMNYRDHRKIIVIDGVTAITGGSNIGDEYINVIDRHGYWKDTFLILRGGAAISFTEMFLSMWQSITHKTYKLEDFCYNPQEECTDTNGFVHPYADSPFDNVDTAKNIYLQIINSARDYLYITTPYLVVDDEMLGALCLAAQSGVKVKIVTPKNGDHWYVHMMTRSSYGPLMEAGVQIYEYTPGFMHSKLIVADDEVATVGTVNMDYRSFYLHHECGVWLCHNKTVLDVRGDIDQAVAVSERIRLEAWNKRPAGTKLLEACLKLFTPLM